VACAVVDRAAHRPEGDEWCGSPQGRDAMSAKGPARSPCGSCPYRLDVPSGVWAAEEYDKLPPYDGETHEQPPTAFFCHAQNGRLCAGWVGCHDMAHSLGLRLAAAMGLLAGGDVDAALDYESPVPLHASGAAAAEHGKIGIAIPDDEARRAIAKLEARRQRRRP
jgi:hypothetical protein